MVIQDTGWGSIREGAHTDDGNQEYEFPDADSPYTADGQPVIDGATITVC